MPSEQGLITLEDVRKAREVLANSSLGVCKTPLIKNTNMFPGLENAEVYLKLENMQTTGSFKIRGVASQMAIIPDDVKRREKKLITISAGNYGKAFAYALNKLNLSGLCLMPLTAPSSRVQLIKSFGVEVKQIPSSDLLSTVDKYVAEKDFTFLHSFDEINLIAGYGSASLEILEDGVKPDVVIVCCGGGGLVSGVAATFKLSGLTDCRVYAVEPEGSPTMYESYKKGEAVTIPTVNSVAGGLSPPFAGKLTYQHCRKFVEDVVLVTDKELIDTMAMFYKRGLVVEPSGCAAMAALINGRIPDVTGKKVVVFVTGGNITSEEMTVHLK
ncbi:L-threonine dehydratase catabolic TdcB-like isoform X1 [Ylistrum balloti]|uniref:L-threonine dehydratase catabolic TdcB-like isoform X1 n=1 Tax=Ylistrum balloti TaxID=509963 RepID=UPI0029059C20|nr:L-threonine dehydratase catabolic TdcB-like isoform X1 [Ylistrum balloti]